jgi:hypothetical protein
MELASLWGKQSIRYPSALSAEKACLVGPSRTLHKTPCSSAKTERDKERERRGKERKAVASERLAKILPQDVKRPNRSEEELAEAEKRVKEHSRQCMRELRQYQSDQKRRRRLRCALDEKSRVGPAIPGKWQVQQSFMVWPISVRGKRKHAWTYHLPLAAISARSMPVTAVANRRRRC